MFVGYAPLSFILSLLFCVGLMYLDKKAAIAGDINVRESAQTLHNKSISRFGGVAIYLSTIFTTYLFGFDWNSNGESKPPRSSNLPRLGINLSFIESNAPFLCLATINSPCPSEGVFISSSHSVIP